VRAAAADVVLVFGDVGQVREIGKRAHHRIGLVAGQDFQHAVQLGGAGVGFAAEAHGGLADGFDHLVDFLAFLFAHDVAQQATEQADVFFQGASLSVLRAGLLTVLLAGLRLAEWRVGDWNGHCVVLDF
jgi:hypothetical protein